MGQFTEKLSFFIMREWDEQEQNPFINSTLKLQGSKGLFHFKS